jgi:RNA polymerase sigma-70 factor, ECF subfamily
LKKYRNIHEHLIEKCRNRDPKAQFEIYKLYYKAMYNTCYRIVNNPDDAEDIMQEAFLAAFEKIDTYNGEVSFGAWLKRIVINRSLDELKKKRAELVPLDPTTTRDDFIEEINFSEDNIEHEIERIKEAIKELAEGYKIVLTLYLLEGYDHDEISEILNISSSNSRSQYSRAKKRLKEILEKKE